MQREPRWARIGGRLELPYVEQGDRSGRPLVCLHGYAESWRSFAPVLAELPAEVWAFSLGQRGHGGTRTIANDYSLGALARDVASFMDAVGLEPAVVAGSSSGGYVAQQLAVDRPERVAALALIGSPRTLHRLPAADALAARLGAMAGRVEAAVARELIAGLVSRPVPDRFLREMVDDAVAVPLDVWRAALAALTSATPPTEAGAITTPTLILWGDHDGVVGRAEAEALRDAIPGSALHVYPGVGHLPAWEAPARVARDIARFVRGLPA